MSLQGVVEDVVVEREVEEPEFFLNMIRSMSVMDGFVNEARIWSRRRNAIGGNTLPDLDKFHKQLKKRSLSRTENKNEHLALPTISENIAQ